MKPTTVLIPYRFPAPRHLQRLISRATLLAATCALGACGLPDRGNRTVSTTMGNGGRTALGAAFGQQLAAHPGSSGLHSLPNGRDALTARIALADAAQQSLDVQYYIWKNDTTGKLLIERLLGAADRGVRVRLLLDDVGTAPSDEVLLAVDSHPNLEIRMFNPIRTRSLRLLGMAIDFSRINKRMHNKSFIADGQIAIVGGRNVGDEYFDADETSNFADLDVSAIGPVVKEASTAFDLYWNHQASIPITELSSKIPSPEKWAAQRAALVAHRSTVEQSAYGAAGRNTELAVQIKNRTVSYRWGHASIVSDHPDKVLGSGGEHTHLAPKLRKTLETTRRELFLVSPYFVPGKKGVALLAEVRRRGVRVVVITNSLASTDGIPVHAGYQRYRKPLIEAGVELYEMKPTAGTRPGRKSNGFSGSSGGSSGASLHAKTFAFDRRIGFIGSYNLDPRSSKLNTEMGVLFDCPALAERLPGTTERIIDHDAYRVELAGKNLVWITHEGSREIRLTSEPGASLWKRTKVRVLSWLPIEGLL